jgi:hypothetical protein
VLRGAAVACHADLDRRAPDAIGCCSVTPAGPQVAGRRPRPRGPMPSPGARRSIEWNRAPAAVERRAARGLARAPWIRGSRSSARPDSASGKRSDQRVLRERRGRGAGARASTTGRGARRHARVWRSSLGRRSRGRASGRRSPPIASCRRAPAPSCAP